MSTDTERHEAQEVRYDEEISRRWVSATLGGILGLTVLAIVSMWWLSGFFVSSGAAKDRVLTPVELERREAILQDDDRLQGGADYDELVREMGGVVPPDVVSTWPGDVELPPHPRVQYAPMNDWLVLKHGFTQELTTFGWVDEEAGLARVPVDFAIGRVVEAGELQARPPLLTPRSMELGGALGGTTPTTSGVTPEPEGRAEESGAAEPEEPPAEEGEGL